MGVFCFRTALRTALAESSAPNSSPTVVSELKSQVHSVYSLVTVCPFVYRHMALIRLYDLNMYSVLQSHSDFWTASAAENYLAAVPGAMLFDSFEKTNELALAIQESEKSAAGVRPF